MTISGHINLINNPQAFFGQLLTGTKKPTTGFAPAKMPGFSVTMTSVFMGFIPITIPGTFNPADGSFTLPAVPPQLPGFGPNDLVSLNVTLHGTPFYRTERFPHAHLTEDLEIFVYQPNIPASDGIAAGLISKGLNGQGLPSDTKLTANPWGIGVAGDQSGADVQFGISLIPDTSPNLAVFFDMALHNWNIHVGWPASCVTSANGILAKIRA
jgi:hypothetical protein